MAYTKAQWDDFQKALPLEDRTSYAEYLQVVNPGGTTAPTVSITEQVASINSALANMTSGKTLTSAEKQLLNIGTSKKTSSIYSKGMRIDSAGNYVGYNPEMEGMTSKSASTTATPTPAQSVPIPNDAEIKAENARVEAEYQAYLAEQKATQAAAEAAAAQATAAAEAAKKAEDDAKAAQEAADAAAASNAANAAQLAEAAATAAALAEATQAAADAAAANADATAGLPGAEGTAITGTPVVTGTPVETVTIPDPTGPEALGFYNKLKGQATSGKPLTAEENTFVSNYLKHRAGILGGLQFQGKQLTAEQLAEKNFLVGLGYIAPATPATPATITTADTTATDVTATDVTATDVTATDVTPERPAGVNQFFVYNPTTKTWERPAKPQDGATYTWDDAVGWVQESPSVERPPGTPAAYIYDETTKKWIKPTQTDPNTTWDDDKGWIAKVATARTILSTTYIGAGATRKKVITYSDNTTETIDDPEVVTEKVKTAAELAAEAAAATAAANAKAAADLEYNGRMSVYASLSDRFAQYGLTSLAEMIKTLAMKGATEATITLALQGTDAYKIRFAANDERLKKGLRVLSPAEYVNTEDAYRQVLRAYGLKQFDNDEYVKQFIANDMSPTELSNRVVTAVQRVQNADPALINQLKKYYGIGATDMVAYVLDPEQQFQKIERQIAASEIGVAAGRQGLEAGVSVAEQLAAQGVTEAEARKGYSTIADILPTAEKLSDIYGTTLDEYRQPEAEQEQFNSLASAQRKRLNLRAREIAAFSGASGTNRTSLTTSSVGKIQNPERTHRPRQSNRPIVGASQFPRIELWPAN